MTIVDNKSDENINKVNKGVKIQVFLFILYCIIVIIVNHFYIRLVSNLNQLKIR